MGDLKSQNKNLNFLLFLILNKKQKKKNRIKKRITKKKCLNLMPCLIMMINQ